MEAHAHDLTAMPRRIPLLDRAGALGPSEARGGQQDLAQAITAPGADEGWALTDHHHPRHADGAWCVAAAQATDVAGSAPARDDPGDGAQGRMEPRTSGITSASEW